MRSHKLIAIFLLFIFLIGLDTCYAESDRSTPVFNGEWHLHFIEMDKLRFLASNMSISGNLMIGDNGISLIDTTVGDNNDLMVGSWVASNNKLVIISDGVKMIGYYNDDLLSLEIDSSTKFIYSREPVDQANQIHRNAKPKDIPTLENDFYALGYPQFLYIPGANGGISKDDNSGEKSIHMNGNQVYLFMDSSYYMTKAKIEVPVNSKNFNSSIMEYYINPFVEFVKVITDNEVTTDDQERLLSTFIDAFDDAENKPKSIVVNGFTFKISLDRFYNLIILEC